MKRILICFIGTGEYLEFLPQFYEKVMDNFCPDHHRDILVLTDGEIPEVPENVILKHIEHKEWALYYSRKIWGYFGETRDCPEI